jgi:hypothetical protein
MNTIAQMIVSGEIDLSIILGVFVGGTIGLYFLLERKKCKECDSSIPKKAKKCPKCGSTQ